jgi:hypothetical protein
LGTGAGVDDLKISPKLKEGLGAADFFDGAAFAKTLGAGGAFFGAAGSSFVGLRIESKTPDIGVGVGGATFGGGLSCFCLSSHSRALPRTISAASSAIFLWSATRLASASAAAVTLKMQTMKNVSSWYHSRQERIPMKNQ